MKTLSTTTTTFAAIAMAWVAFSGSSANADLLVEEEFLYNSGENINDQSGGFGFDGPWVSTISHGQIYKIETTGLSFSTLRVEGNSVSRFGAAGRAQAHRPLLGSVQTALTGDNTTMWFSLLFKAPVQHRYAAFLFGTGAFTTATSPILATAGDGFGIALVAPDGTSDGDGTINALAFDNSTTPTVVASTFNPGTATSLLVGKINWKADGTPDEFFLFNVTDVDTEPAENTAIASITTLDLDQSAINTAAIWDTNNAVTDEIRFATSFAGAMGTMPDSDNDGMSDEFELAHTTPPSPIDLDPNDDLENGGAGDGLTNLQEFQYGTDPHDSDSDDDTLTDGAEVAGVGSRPATNPAKADTDDDTLDDLVETNTGIIISATDTGTNPALSDTDLDGLNDRVELDAYLVAPGTSTHPLMADTDSDGAGDWYELAASFTDPLNSADRPSIPYPLPDPGSSTGSTNKPVKVYIMSGQSNMVAFGRVYGPVPGTLEELTKREYKFPNLIDGSGIWTTRNDVKYRGVISAFGNGPLVPGFGANAAFFGPELGFGHMMGWYHDEPVLLIKSSIGNRSLSWDCLPPGSASFVDNVTNYAGYGDYGNWAVGTNPPTSGTWYAGKQYDDYFLDEGDMGPKGWVETIAYPINCQVHHNGVAYNCKAVHTSGALSEPGVGGESSTYWNVHSVFNVTDILDNFATEYPEYAAQGFKIAGYVWWQGHKDGGETGTGTAGIAATRYEDNLVNLIDSLRDYYENRYPANTVTDAPFVVATVGFGGGTWNPGSSGAVIHAAQMAVSNPGAHPDYVGNVSSVDTTDYWRDFGPSGESYHYNWNAETYLLTGDALGRAMVDLLIGNNPADYNTWAAQYSAAYLINPDSDFTGNGLTNNEARIWGINPTSSVTVNPISIPLDATAGTLTYTRRDTGLTALTYEVWTSPDLKNWTQDTDATQAATANTPVADVETVLVTLTASSENGKLFVQIRVVE